ncbi:MAG: CBS domain-containing protein [Kiloniellales bacterium]
MTSDVSLVNPATTVNEASRLMRDHDIGALPIGEDDRLVGMVTDRDIVLRAVADGKDPTATRVSEVMSDRILYCFDDQSIDEVATNMGDNQVRRLPVLNRDKRLVGIVSLGDLSVGGAAGVASEALEQISEPHRH